MNMNWSKLKSDSHHVTLDDWEIKRIYQSAYGNGKHDFVLRHHQKLPQGRVFINTTKEKVIAEIPKIIKNHKKEK